MIRKGPNRPDVTRANQFAAQYFGHRPVSVKFTSNPDAASRAFKRHLRRVHKAGNQLIGLNWWSGVHLPLGASGRKHLVFLNRNPRSNMGNPLSVPELEEVAAHELFHAQFARHRKLIGKPVFRDANELAAHMASLEYLRKYHPKEFAARLNSNGGSLSFIGLPTNFGSTFAMLAHAEFSEAERVQIIEQLKNGHFAARKHLVSWLRERLREKSRVIPRIEKWLAAK